MLLFNRCICVFLFFSLCFYCFYFLSMYLFSLWATIFNKLMFMFNAPVNYFVTATAGEVLFLVAFARVSLLDGAARCKRRRRLMFFCALSVFFLNFFERLLSNGWTDFHQIFTNKRLCGVFVNGCTSVKITPPPKKKNWRPKASTFGAKIQTPLSSNGHCAETRRNYVKLNNWYNYKI